ncbi:high mobility group B protein 3-like isoform X1 [Camellia sinensis]|uniref:high mobility group B protein 3-like isoform X1 n=1 Tax=Camellia sinensis TaxID=4442 RepID=UPI0010358FFD|nr:high mobility group B protein 3-like isoform X1 [Camellia sinensis]
MHVIQSVFFCYVSIDFFVVRLSVKRGAPSEKDGKKPAAKKGKVAKDPNKSKRPASVFFVFMEEFRKTYKEKHPNNKSVAAVGKAGGDKWKSLSEAEKAPYVAKAEKRKTEYNKTLEAYNKKMVEGPADEEESDKLRSEVNDEDDEDDESGEFYALSWLVIVDAMIILKIVSMGRKKFSADFQLMFRLLKLFQFIGSVVTVVILFAFLSLTVYFIAFFFLANQNEILILVFNRNNN